MSSKPPLFLAALSIGCGVLVFFLFRLFSVQDASPIRFQSSDYEAPYSGIFYAVLTVDESFDDRYIQELLGYSAQLKFISESRRVLL